MPRLSLFASALPSLDLLLGHRTSSYPSDVTSNAISSAVRKDGLYPRLFRLSALGLLLMGTGCEITRPNVSYDACLAGEAPCDESCNGLDDDEDGVVDEGLSDTCAIMVGKVLSRSGIEGGFGRALATVKDLDGDGYSELLVSATRSSEDLTASDPREGEVSLILGATQTLKWTVRSGGDFGHALVSGAFQTDTEDPVWCSGAPTREESVGVGRVICLNFEGEVVSRYSSQGDFGIGRWLSKQSMSEYEERLVISEPLWGREILDDDDQPQGETDDRGRVLSLMLNEGQLEIVQELVGNDVEQRVGERVIAIPDVNGDDISDWLMTGYSSEGARQVWVVDGSVEGDLRRLKRFSTSDETHGLFGESLAWGRWDQGTDDVLLGFGAPYISVERDEELVSTGRVYFTTGDGEPRGTNSALISSDELFGLGMSMVSVTVGDEELLIIAGPRLLRVISFQEGQPQVRQEFVLPFGARPVLAASPELEPNGELRVWIGLAELEEVHLLTLRPASSTTSNPENDTRD